MEEFHSELEREIANLYANHAGELIRYATLTLHRQDGAADAVQEVFLRYFAERKCGGSIDHPRAWLFRVLHNHIMDRLDLASVKREVSAESAAEPLAMAQNPEQILSRSQTAREIAAGLTAREWDCLRLRAQGLSYEEVAQVLGIRSGTVGALLTRVHKKLRRASGEDQSLRMGIAEALWTLVNEGGVHEGGAYSS